ncbi:MAG: hypothetical protein ACREV5_07410 [Steroidobacter sp.]
MALPGRFEPRVAQRVFAAVLSGALHLGMFFVIVLSGGRHDGIESGETPSTQLVLFEAPDVNHAEGVDLPPLEPTIPTMEIEEQLQADNGPPASLPTDAITTELADADLEPPHELHATTDEIAINAIHPTPTFAMSHAEKAALSQRLARLAEEFVKEPQAHVAWEQDGKQYSAVLILERANDGTALDRVVAEVSAAARGRKLTTRVSLKRLAFSQFTQMVDRWDPMVQLHDDEIVGRFHSNSRFSVTYDSRTAPKFLGKVTTAARGFDTESIGRGRESDIFRGGVETRADRIPLPEELQPFEWGPQDANARIHNLAHDTRIRFFADGSYTWRTDGSAATEYLNAPSEHPVYLIAARGATLYVKGVVAGKILVYSPQKIVVEGSLTYAHDPRNFPDSRDYLGLVCDRYIEVAPPRVTGPGDLEIDAAIFAGRRFVVRDIDHRRSATLRIYGSVSAGSLSASEPRYATKVEYDERFEHRRPPGFPSTDRYEVENWDGQWTEASERIADDAF